ncbi:MAG: hypothetical protein R3F19_09260 [Verrucomicrobiales bacterium]
MSTAIEHSIDAANRMKGTGESLGISVVTLRENHGETVVEEDLKGVTWASSVDRFSMQARSSCSHAEDALHVENEIAAQTDRPGIGAGQVVAASVAWLGQLPHFCFSHGWRSSQDLRRWLLICSRLLSMEESMAAVVTA